MKDQVLDKFMSKAIEYLEQTEVFLKDQVPDFFTQVVQYHLAISLFWVVLSLAIIAISSAQLLRIRKMDDLEEWDVGIAVVSGFLIVMFFMVFSANISTTIKASVAPKVFIVDYLRGDE